jgi:hypothetical protein
MKPSLNLKKLSAALLLLAGAQSAEALDPTQSANITLYISGGAAQDPAFDSFIAALALPGTFDVYYDNASASNPGSRYRAYFFTTDNTKIPGLSTGSAPVNVLIYKRSFGGAGYGVAPLLDPAYKVNQLDIKQAGAVSPKQAGEAFYRVAGSALQSTVSDAGITGVNPELFGGINTPTPASGDPAFPSVDVSKASNILEIVPAGGLTYGLAVTLDLYKVLQAAQIETGTLPAGTQIGDYKNEASIPTLSRAFVASLLSGKVKTWDDVRVIDERPIAAGATKGNDLGSLTTFANKAGVTAPSTNGKNLVAVGNRNKGAAIGAAFSAVFLNAPGTANAFNPATSPGNPANGPVVAQAPGASQQEALLTDWQNGGNASTYNTDGGKHWGVAQQSTDWNSSGAIGKDPAKPYRYVRIDGAAATLQNVANGTYPVWSEQTIQWRRADVSPAGPSGDKLVILKKIADDVGNAAAAAAVNAKIVTTFGPTGLFAVSTSSTVSSNDTPFDTTKPIVNYTHVNGGVLSGSVAPVYNSAKPGTVALK